MWWINGVNVNTLYYTDIKIMQAHNEKFYLVMAGQSSDVLAQAKILQADPTLLSLIQEPRPRSHPDHRETPQHIFW